jgi:hypothetical protein
MDEKKFKIDFFELAFLVEACIPPTSIARSMFWNEVINDYYYQMTTDERSRLHEWINRNLYYQQRLEEKNEKVLTFEARFNPDNQYKVYTKDKEFDTFLFDGRYYTYYSAGSKTVLIDPDQIIKIEKIKYENSDT